ncbi:MAG TPA: cytochrome c biogenesis protein CcdA [Actinomycetota bacterium]|nr:cytochrome c biogenesis protein CcdA [Actinomycetota bacterium]
MIAAAAENIGAWWAPALAFVAGAVSFASPCVLPLVPGYLSFVTGSVAASETVRRRPLVPILLFVAGFTVVFTAIGALVTRVDDLIVYLRGDVAQLVFGGFVGVIGLLMLGYAFSVGPFRLYEERRPFLERARIGSWGAFPLGIAFGAGWTPCIGPVLGAILAVAAGSGADAWRGAFLLVCYSLGLGVPFVLVGLGVGRLGALEWVKRNYRWLAGASGTLLVLAGVLIATGQFTRITTSLQRYLPAL